MIHIFHATASTSNFEAYAEVLSDGTLKIIVHSDDDDVLDPTYTALSAVVQINVHSLDDLDDDDESENNEDIWATPEYWLKRLQPALKEHLEEDPDWERRF